MADSLERSLECEVCCEQFDLATRRPKLLSCGHTVCLTCVVGIRDKARDARSDAETAFLCPIDRKETRCKPEELNDNYYIMSLIQELPKPEKARGAGGGSSARFWCLDCKAVADPVCEDKHALRRLHQERAKQMKPTLDLLERAVSTQRRLADKLKAVEAGVRDFAKLQVAETAAAAARGQEVLTRLYDGLDLVGPEWDLVEADVEKARQESEARLAADELTLQLLAEAGTWEVRAAATGGGRWTADVDLGGDGDGLAVVRGLLVHLQRAGVLRLDKEERVPDEEATSKAQEDAVPTPTPQPRQQRQPPQQLQPRQQRQPPQQLQPRQQRQPPQQLQPPQPPQQLQPPQQSQPPQQLQPPQPLQPPLQPQPPLQLQPPLQPLPPSIPARAVPPSDNFFSSVTDALQTLTGGKRTWTLQEMSKRTARELRAEKDVALQSDLPDVSLRGLRCDCDPAWTCALLLKLGPRLQDLGLEGVREEHVTALRGMASLRSLSLEYHESTDPTTGMFGTVLSRTLQKLELNVPVRDLAYWLRKCPAESVRIALADTVQFSHLQLWQIHAAVAATPGNMKDVTLVREVRPNQRAAHTALCAKQCRAFSKWSRVSCSSCQNPTANSDPASSLLDAAIGLFLHA